MSYEFVKTDLFLGAFEFSGDQLLSHVSLRSQYFS